MRKQRAFTLVELLVVIGIIAVLIGILIPALSRAQRQSRITACMSQQRQLALALIMYCQDNDNYFPGGPGIAGSRDKQGNPQPPAFTHWLAHYDPEACNPYALNNDEQSGPTFLFKYVKNQSICYCPADSSFNKKRVGSFWDRNDPNTDYWTSYWYPLSLDYDPMDIWLKTVDVTANDQKPQKITKVKFPLQKVVCIDRMTYHVKFLTDTDKTPFNQANATKTADAKQNLKVVAAFADGHAEYRSVYEMYDSDVNWTGRFNINNPATYAKGRAGVLWKDFE